MAENLHLHRVIMLLTFAAIIYGTTFNEIIVNPKTKSTIQLTIDSTTNQLIKCKISNHRQKKQSLDYEKVLLWKEAEKFCQHLNKGDVSLTNLVYPGTKWCGTGNSAKNLSDLGENRQADLCCRSHDLCADSIAPGQTRHSIENDTPFTMSNCECDAEFERCLKSNRLDEASIMIRNLFFNVAKLKCFRKQHPTLRCLKYRKRKHRSCQIYELDYTKPKTYQLFDSSGPIFI